MEPFWKNICEVRLLPLTTEHAPETGVLENPEVYNKNESNITLSALAMKLKKKDKALFEKEISDVICLRLSQYY